MSEWIDVLETAPTPWETVLVQTMNSDIGGKQITDGIIVAYFYRRSDGNFEWRSDLTGSRKFYVKYWMPLPAPPEAK